METHNGFRRKNDNMTVRGSEGRSAPGGNIVSSTCFDLLGRSVPRGRKSTPDEALVVRTEKIFCGIVLYQHPDRGYVASGYIIFADNETLYFQSEDDSYRQLLMQSRKIAERIARVYMGEVETGAFDQSGRFLPAESSPLPGTGRADST